MKHSIFSEKSKSGEVVYYSTISGESENGKWSNRVATLKDRIVFADKMAGMRLRFFLGTSRVLTDIQASILLAILEEGTVLTEKVVRKKDVDIDLKTGQPLTEDKETTVLKSIKVDVTNKEMAELLQMATDAMPKDDPETSDNLE